MGIILHKQKALMGRRRGFSPLREPVVGANRRGTPRGYWPRSRRSELFSRIGREVPLQAAALLEAKSAHRVTVRGIRVVPRDMIYCAPDETSGAFFVPEFQKEEKP